MKKGKEATKLPDGVLMPEKLELANKMLKGLKIPDNRSQEFKRAKKVSDNIKG